LALSLRWAKKYSAETPVSDLLRGNFARF